MGKPYVRRRAAKGKPEKFECTKCGEEFLTKYEFKQHHNGNHQAPQKT